MKRVLNVIVILTLITMASFQSPDFPSTGVTIKKRWDMPAKLREISGIACLDGERFACIQDELGVIFIFNTGNNSIEKEIPFGGTGDYEGLTLVNETIWVVRADGHLFEIKNIHSGNPSVAEFTTPLTKQNDIESICYDKKNNRLLLTAKEAEPGNPTAYKGIYGFDLSTMKMIAEPVIKIDLLNKVFSQKKNRGSKIMPSDIAIHPSSGDIYIIDGRNSKLLVSGATGEIKKLYQLNTIHFAQPEGIAFNSSGELFISNEARVQSGNIIHVEIKGE